MIWLIDHTSYAITLDPELSEYKRRYFRVKGYKRKNMIGETAEPRTMTYANGLLRLATILSDNGEQCRYMHYPELEAYLDGGGTDFPETVAFSTVCPTVPRAARLAERIKSASPRTRVYVGGVQVNSAPKEVAKRFTVFDKLITGHEQQAASAIAGRELSPGKRYIDFSLLPHPLTDYAINTFTTLGCPFSCGYCADGRAPKLAVADDAMLSQMKLPRRTLVHIFDSVFGYSTERALAICKNLQRLDHGCLLSCDMRAELLTEQLVREMEKAGFVEIRLGIESADEELLRGNGRTLAPGKCIETIKMIRACSNIYITLYSVTGLPGTTEDSHCRTLDMFHELLVSGRADEVKNALYVPYPYDGLDYSGQGVRISDEDWSHYDRQSYPVFETGLISRDRLWALYLKTQAHIADSWLESVGFRSYDELPDAGGYYSEYVQSNYKLTESDE